jgi:hypothetical protein
MIGLAEDAGRFFFFWFCMILADLMFGTGQPIRDTARTWRMGLPVRMTRPFVDGTAVSSDADTDCSASLDCLLLCFCVCFFFVCVVVFEGFRAICYRVVAIDQAQQYAMPIMVRTAHTALFVHHAMKRVAQSVGSCLSFGDFLFLRLSVFVSVCRTS